METFLLIDLGGRITLSWSKTRFTAKSAIWRKSKKMDFLQNEEKFWKKKFFMFSYIKIVNFGTVTQNSSEEVIVVKNLIYWNLVYTPHPQKITLKSIFDPKNEIGPIWSK